MPNIYKVFVSFLLCIIIASLVEGSVEITSTTINNLNYHSYSSEEDTFTVFDDEGELNNSDELVQVKDELLQEADDWNTGIVRPNDQTRSGVNVVIEKHLILASSNQRIPYTLNKIRPKIVEQADSFKVHIVTENGEILSSIDDWSGKSELLLSVDGVIYTPQQIEIEYLENRFKPGYQGNFILKALENVMEWSRIMFLKNHGFSKKKFQMKHASPKEPDWHTVLTMCVFNDQVDCNSGRHRKVFHDGRIVNLY